METVVAKKSIATFLNMNSTSKFLDDILKDKKAEFVSNLITITENDANMAACDPAALMKCALNATALNLPLNKNLGMAYVIAYSGIPSFQIGYKGIIQLAIRTGAYEFINASDVREGEIKRNKFTGEVTFYDENPDGKIVGYLAFLKLKTGFTASLYMTEEQIESHALRFSKMYQSDKKFNSMKSKWSDPSARPKMALKTVLKGLLGTYGLMTTEFAKAFESDNEEEQSNDNNRGFTEVQVIDQKEPSNEPEKVAI